MPSRPPSIEPPPRSATPSAGPADSTSTLLRCNESENDVCEAAYAAFRARAQRRTRVSCAAISGAAHAAAFTATVAAAAPGGPPPIAWMYLIMTCFCVALGAVMAKQRGAWAAELAAAAAAAALLFAVDPASGAAPQLYCALPLACGVMFGPPWRIYAALCVVHAARGAVALAPGGLPGPPSCVVAASLIGAGLLYAQERTLRDNFVRATRARGVRAYARRAAAAAVTVDAAHAAARRPGARRCSGRSTGQSSRSRTHVCAPADIAASYACIIPPIFAFGAGRRTFCRWRHSCLAGVGLCVCARELVGAFLGARAHPCSRARRTSAAAVAAAAAAAQATRSVTRCTACPRASRRASAGTCRPRNCARSCSPSPMACG